MRVKLLYFFIFFSISFASGQIDYVNPNFIEPKEIASKKEKSKPFGNNFSIGGNFSFLFGNVTLIDLSPQISTEILPKIHVGAGLTYIFYNDRFQQYASSIFGGRLFSRWFPLPYLFTHLEYEVLNGEWLVGQTFNIHALYLGVGYRSAFGDHSGFDVLLLFNLNQNAYSPYSNPTFRVGFMLGI